MTFDWNSLEKLYSPLITMASVLLGSVLVTHRERTREKERIKSESSYLAILVVAHLDRFVNGCVSVAFDDGTLEGQLAGKNGEYREATTKIPVFDPLGLNVDWKVLPENLMYGILNLPYQVEQLTNQINAEAEFDDSLDYTLTFRARQHEFAVLGLEVSDLVKRLRHHAGLSVEARLGNDRSREDALREIRDKIASARAAYEAR
jgi:hypothetical protein